MVNVIRFVLFGAGVYILLPLGESKAADLELIDKVNEFRQQPVDCSAADAQALTRLEPHEALTQVVRSPVSDLQSDLRAAGYRAAYAQLIRVQMSGQGRENMEQTFAQISAAQCELLRQPHWQHIGVYTEQREWRLILAQPLIADDLGDWRHAGQRILALTNQARQQGQYCADTYYPPAPEVSWDDQLGNAALAHSHDMAEYNYFSHQGRGGEQPAERMTQAGYRWRLAGENLASGSGSPEQAVQGWIDSPSHCVNLMNPDFTQMGAAYSTDAGSDGYIYWTQKFATPF